MKEFNLIMAMSPKGGIGYKNKLPWNSKNDMAYFRQVTTHVPTMLQLMNVVIMGRKRLNHCQREANLYLEELILS